MTMLSIIIGASGVQEVDILGRTQLQDMQLKMAQQIVFTTGRSINFSTMTCTD